MKKNLPEKIDAFLKERYSLEHLKDLVKEKQVPLHRHTFWYYLGGTTLFLIFIQIITGILLLFYYKPTADGAFESVKFIMTKVEFGWMIRSVHAWAGNFAILSAFVHLFSTFFLRAYRKPRELTWITGCILFFILLAFGFTGYLLPWNTLSFFATKVGTEIAAKVPLIGTLLSQILRGGNEVGDATLGRFFAIHISILPFLLTFLMLVHLMMVQIQGMSWPLSVPAEKRNRSFPFFPNFFLRDLVVWLTIFGIMLSLSVYFPTELGQKADPFLPTPTGIKPEWYFLSMFETLKFFPGYIGPMEGEVVAIVLLSLVCAGMVVIPFIDFWTKRERWSPFLVLGAIALIYMVATTIMSYYGITLWKT
jgi:cytochrome b6